MVLALFAVTAAASDGEIQISDFTVHWTGLLCLLIFALAYLLVAGEEPLSLRKSKPMMVAACMIWVFVAIAYSGAGDTHTAEAIFRSAIEHYIELFLFLLAAMTYINVMTERGIFARLRQWLSNRGFTLRQIYWVTGLLTFSLSPFIANIAVALLMTTVLIAIAPDNRRFIVAGCINVVVAANAGGVFSPFGDITTLMVWQQGLIDFHDFFRLFLPSLVNWLIPAVILSFSIPVASTGMATGDAELLEGAWVVVGFFVLTLILSVWIEGALGLPAVIGMMTGLGVLKLYGYRLKRRGIMHTSRTVSPGKQTRFDIFRALERSEWDTLMFMFGIIVSVSGLHAMGYLMLTSEVLYGILGPTAANVILGVLSALVENVAVMYSVLSMHPDMSHAQWLLITLTAGVGGSLFSIGSAAGVAVMGQAKGTYTFMTHLRWTWAIALGYAASIWVHLMINVGGG